MWRFCFFSAILIKLNLERKYDPADLFAEDEKDLNHIIAQKSPLTVTVWNSCFDERRNDKVYLHTPTMTL